MTRSIKDWCRDAHALAVEKGFHHKPCPGHTEGQERLGCMRCRGTGLVPVDHKSPTRIGSRLALIHGEISEALECVARGEMGLYWENQHGIRWHDGIDAAALRREKHAAGFTKPEGFPIELADVFLRRADDAEARGVAMDLSELHWANEQLHLAECDFPDNPEHVATALDLLHDCVRCVRDPEHAWKFDSLLLAIAQWQGIDLLAMAELKHEYNKTRPIRHGGKVL